MPDNAIPSRVQCPNCGSAAVWYDRAAFGWRCDSCDHGYWQPASVTQLRLGAPQVYHDPDRRLYWVPVSDALFPTLEDEWSEPVQVKIEDGQMVVRKADP